MAIQLGSIVEGMQHITHGDKAELQVGDFVVVVEETHGWGNVKKGMVGKVRETGYSYGVDFGRFHNDWTGHRSCFIKITGSALKDIQETYAKEANAKVVADIKKYKADKVSSFKLQARVEIQSFKYTESVVVDVSIDLGKISRLRTEEGLKNRLIDLVIAEASKKVHPTRIEYLSYIEGLDRYYGTVKGDTLKERVVLACQTQ